MIVEAVVTVFVGLVNFITGLLPSMDPPAWLSSGDGLMGTVWGYGAGLGAWVPWSLAGTVLASALACAASGFVIKVVRIVASFFTAGGGSAA